MKGYKFYLQYPSNQAKRKATRRNLGEHEGNVIATIGSWHVSNGEIMEECLAAVYTEPNSPVCGSSASMGYIRENCKRISEAQARQIHPALFACLDD